MFDGVWGSFVAHLRTFQVVRTPCTVLQCVFGTSQSSSQCNAGPAACIPVPSASARTAAAGVTRRGGGVPARSAAPKSATGITCGGALKAAFADVQYATYIIEPHGFCPLRVPRRSLRVEEQKKFKHFNSGLAQRGGPGPSPGPRKTPAR